MINADKQDANIFPAFSISNIICKIVQHLNLLLVLFLIFSINIYCKLSKIIMRRLTALKLLSLSGRQHGFWKTNQVSEGWACLWLHVLASDLEFPSLTAGTGCWMLAKSMLAAPTPGIWPFTTPLRSTSTGWYADPTLSLWHLNNAHHPTLSPKAQPLLR